MALPEVDADVTVRIAGDAASTLYDTFERLRLGRTTLKENGAHKPVVVVDSSDVNIFKRSPIHWVSKSDKSH